jgi:hypothetical protein
VFIITISVLLSAEIFSQPDLRIDPNDVRFRSVFDRIDSTFFINEGDQVLSIDSLGFALNTFYNISFEDNRQIPFIIPPNDTITAYVILENFYHISVTDTIDTVFVYNNGNESPRELKIKIDFFDDDMVTVTCNVRDEIQQPIDDAQLYYFYYGTYLVTSARTDPSGYYSISLPKGSYTIAASKDGYRTMFNNSTPDPFFAPLVQIDSGQTVSVDYELPALATTDYSVSGTVKDTITGNIINKGVVVVRKGNHTPSRMLLENPGVFAGFIQPDGSYSVNVESDSFYFVQAYSNYFLPGFYNDDENASVFWQDADSLLINSNLTGKNLFLQRDLSFGGGTSTGNIILPSYESIGYDGITVIARSVFNGALYSYNFGKDDATFRVNNLPFGTYELIAQRVGLPNAVSEQFTIDSLNTSVDGLTITFNLTDVDDLISQPLDFVLYQNYPNPFNPTTTISFLLPKSEFVSLKIFDVLGREVAVLVNDYLTAGKYEIDFIADKLSSGIYFYKIQTDIFTETKKLILIK